VTRPALSKSWVEILVKLQTSRLADGKPDWGALLQAAGLPKKSESGALSCLEELLAEATAVLRGEDSDLGMSWLSDGEVGKGLNEVNDNGGSLEKLPSSIEELLAEATTQQSKGFDLRS
jgi:hypothetical protein